MLKVSKVTRKHLKRRYRWSPREIIQGIRERLQNKWSVYPRQVEKDENRLYCAAYWRFGTWRRALRAAGFDDQQVAPRSQWTRKKIIQALAELRHQHPEVGQGTLSDNSLAVRRYRTLYGAAKGLSLDWPSIRRRVGLPTFVKHRWTPEAVIRRLQERVKNQQPINAMTVLREERFLYRAGRTHFGSYRQAIRAAGFSFARIHREVFRRNARRRQAALKTLTLPA